MKNTVTIFSILQDYTGNTWFLFFFLAAAGYMLWRESRENRKKIIIVMVAAVVLIFNDLSLKLVSKVVGSETYYRFLWMVPMVPLIGYVIVDLFVRQKKAVCRGLVIAMAAILLVMGGECTLLDPGEGFEAPGKVNYVDPEIVLMAHLIEQDKDKPYPRVASPANIAIPIRLANSNIRNFIKRKTYLKEGKLTSKKAKKVRQKRMYQLVNGERLPVKQIKKAVKNGNIDYIIIGTEHQMDDLMLEAGFTILAETGNFTIYRC